MSQSKNLFICIVFFFAITLVVYAFTPLSEKHLIMTVESDTDGTSQLFYRSKDKDFTEQNSIWVPIATGDNYLSFALPFHPQMIRWDPLHVGKAQFKVKGTHIHAGLVNFSIAPDAFVPRQGVNILSKQDDELIITIDGADPQILITTPANKTFFWQSIVLLLIPFILTVALFLFLRNKP